MRPYGTRKEDGKYTQPSIVNTPAIQPSPLALLAATCSRIGDTFQQNAPSVFTQKNLATLFEKRIHDNVASRTCAIESRTSDLLCLDRTNTESALDSLQQHFQHHQTQQHQTQQHQQHQQHLQNQLLQQQQQQQLLQHQGNHSPTYSTTSPSCFKIKTEESLDYNQNCTENMHICPNIISETRILENQARAAFSKSCCHEPVQSPTSCAHQQISSPQESLSLSTSSACQREIPSPHLPSPTNSSTSSSCLYQTSPLGNQQQQHSSCAVNSMETMKYQSNTLSHLPTPSQSDIVSSNNNNNLMHSQLDSYSKYKPPSINPWQNQHIHRLNGDEHEQPLPPPQQQQQKSSCMLHENYTSSIPTSSIQSQLIAANSQQERNYRSYSPPEQQARQQFPNFQRQQSDYGHSLESHHPSPHYPGTQGMSPPHHQQQQQQQQQQQSYSYPTSFENSIDVKPDPYTLHQQTMRQQQQQQQQQANIISGVPGTYSTHDPHSHPMNTIPATSPDQLGMPPALQSPHYPIAHNHPAGMTSYSCNACNITNSYQGNFHLPQSPDAVPVNAMTGAPDVPPHFADYQYQQQQMFYSRDNRRPRRIACTCPNCRDGENKTVTTKDGKQRKLHVCHIPGCGKIYGKTSHLRAHLRWHAGERPFACNWLFCNKRFTRSDELQRHRRTHTGDKRFECSICMKKFMRSDHLSKHMKTHQSQQNKQKEKNSNEKTTGNNTTPTEQQQKSKADIQQTAKNNNNVDNINMSAEKTTKVVVI